MPNYVKNKVIMKGIGKLPIFKTKEIAKLPIFNSEDMKELDFNLIIKMPEELKIESGWKNGIAIETVLRKLDKWNIVNRKRMVEAYYQYQLKRTQSDEEQLIELGLKLISNYVKFDAETWYEWCIKNWGTKWNALSTEIISDDEITFETAWSAPEQIVAALAKMYPETPVEHWWADEDIGHNTGYKKYSGENELESYYPDSRTSDAFEYYVECWDDTDDLQKDEEGNWELKPVE